MTSSASRRTLFGFHAVLAKLRHDPEAVHEIYLDEGRRDARARDLIRHAESAGAKLIPVDGKRLEAMAPGARHQGVVAHVSAGQRHVTLDDVLDTLEEPAFLLVLDGVQDPHNLGACLRSAAAAGATAVVIPKDKAVQVNATVRKTSAGAADTLPIFSVTNLSRTLRDLQKAGVWIYGLAGEADASLYAIDLKGNVALVLGSEGEGLRRLTRENCDQLVKIPMPGGFESLNVSVASGVALFEAVRQRGA